MTEEEIEIEIKEIRKILILLYELLNENEKPKKLKKSKNKNLVFNFLHKLLKKYVKNVRKRNLEKLMKTDVFDDNKKDNPVFLLNENKQEIRKNNFSGSVYSPPAAKNLPLDKKPKKNRF